MSVCMFFFRAVYLNTRNKFKNRLIPAFSDGKFLFSCTEDPYPSSSIDLKCKERVTDSDSENGSGDEGERKVTKTIKTDLFSSVQRIKLKKKKNTIFLSFFPSEGFCSRYLFLCIIIFITTYPAWQKCLTVIVPEQQAL